MRVRVYATLRAIVGGLDVEMALEPGATARDLALAMVDRWPEMADILIRDGDLSRRVHVYINGRSARHLPDGSDTALKEDDEIDVAPAAAGG